MAGAPLRVALLKAAMTAPTAMLFMALAFVLSQMMNTHSL
jgi:hypothetical protein